ncbi:MAG TPA: acylphosphatase [Thermoplasmata archaeon]|nr:acylphosphatase [Thermoplasmata archaeon]
MTEALTRWRLEARGLVQLVGYRERVRDQAEQRGLVGSVVNDENDPHRVEIVVQGPPETLEEFRKAVSGSEGRSRPKEVMRVEELPPDPGLTDFEVGRGSLPIETLERMEQGNRVLGSMDTRLGSLESLGRETLAETRKVGEKVDRVGREVQGVGAEVRGVRAEVRGVGAEVRDGNRRLEKSLNRMHEDMSVRFDRVDRSYGSIGKTLLRIDKNLEKLSKALLLLAKETHRAAMSASRASSSRAPGRKGRKA